MELISKFLLFSMVLILSNVSSTTAGYNQQTTNQDGNSLYYNDQQKSPAYESSPSQASITGIIENVQTTRKTGRTRKVGGGKDSDYIPYQVLLRIVDGSSTSRCGGSIYSRNPNSHSFTEIITAAHCFPRTTNKREVIVIAGIKEVDEKSTTRQVSIACRVIVHPNYNEGDNRHYNDIALLKLRTPFRRIPNRVEALSIMPVNDVQLSNSAQISGWGTKFDQFRRVVNRLQVADIEIQSCEKEGVPSKGLQRCAGGLNGPDACGGDSGGPLVCKSKDNRSKFLCGVVSHGTTCTRPPPHNVGVYTNVSKYINWINQNQNNNC